MYTPAPERSFREMNVRYRSSTKVLPFVCARRGRGRGGSGPTPQGEGTERVGGCRFEVGSQFTG